MKLRPQFNLRFRDAEQFLDVKYLAEESDIPVNEWVLRQIEREPLLKGGRIAAERQQKIKVQTSSRHSGGSGDDLGSHSTAVAEYPVCPRCGKGNNVKELEPGRFHCDKCGVNFAG